MEPFLSLSPHVYTVQQKYGLSLVRIMQVMSKDLFDYLVREKIADGPLIAKWRKPGYEILCSMLAIQKV